MARRRCNPSTSTGLHTISAHYPNSHRVATAALVGVESTDSHELSRLLSHRGLPYGGASGSCVPKHLLHCRLLQASRTCRSALKLPSDKLADE